MRIQHNIMAMNSYRNYNSNISGLSTNLEKLSSGYRINRAGDDAAGLAISEKMRAQITGLDAAQKNVKDGISLVKTAEGALQEVQDMLNRSVYLATQSANGTYDNDVDRKNLQKELDALKSEIDRIADSSNFNGKKLLNGDLSSVADVTLTDGGGAAATFTASGLADAGFADGLSVTGAGEGTTIKVTHKAAVTGTNASGTGTAAGAAVTITGTKTTALNGKSLTVKLAATGTNDTTAALDASGNLTITLAANSTLTQNTDLQTAIDNALNGTIDAGSCTEENATEIAAAWKDVSVTVAATPYSAPSASGSVQDIMSAAPLSGGVADSNATLTISDGTKTSTAVADAAAFADGEVLTFTGDLAVSNAKIGTAANLPTNNGTTEETIGNMGTSSETGATTEIDYTGKTGGEAIGSTVKVDGNTYEFVKTGGTATKEGAVAVEIAENATGAQVADALKTAIIAKGGNIVETADATGESSIAVTDAKITITTFDKGTAAKALEVDQTGGGLTLQIGDTADSYNRLTVSVGDMHTEALGLKGVEISTLTGAQNAVQALKNAINTVSATRGDLGAIQNRLEHTANNLAVMEENITDAESTVRDTDVADEMMAYTKNNILIQSAQAMLAQANAVPQGVLQLLQ